MGKLCATICFTYCMLAHSTIIPNTNHLFITDSIANTNIKPELTIAFEATTFWGLSVLRLYLVSISSGDSKSVSFEDFLHTVPDLDNPERNNTK